MNVVDLRKLLTYGMMVCAFATLHLSRELSPVVLVLFYLGTTVSWFWEPPRIDWARWARPWTAATLAVFGFTLVDLFVLGEFFLVSALNFLLFLATAKLFQRAEDKDYHQAMALSLLLLAAGAALNENLSYGLLFAVYVVIATLGMTTQHLNLEIAMHPGMRRPRMERAILVATSLLGVAVFVGSAAFFFLFPRVGIGAFVQQSRRGVTSSGFGESVELGGHGTINTDASVVLRVRFPDGLSQPIDQIRWRGLSLDRYDGRRWGDTDEDPVRTTRFEGGQGYSLVRSSSFASWDALTRDTIRVEINQEPLADSNVLFAPGRPIAMQLPGALTDLPDSMFGRTVTADTTGEISFRTRNSLGVRYVMFGLPIGGDDRLRNVGWSETDLDYGAELVARVRARSDDPPLLATDEPTSPPPEESAEDSAEDPAEDSAEASADDVSFALAEPRPAPERPSGDSDDEASPHDPRSTDGALDALLPTQLAPAPASARVALTSAERIPWTELREAFDTRDDLRLRRGERKLFELYLQLPDGAITPRMAELTDSLRADHPTPWAFTQALIVWMDDNLTYTTDLPEPSGPDANLVDEFLFEWQRGHCEYFATSLVLLLRSHGIPARIVNGFLGGDYNDVGDFYAVRQANAHSWVEVFFPEQGWVEVDPTPGGSVAFAPGGRFPRFAMFVDNMRLMWFRWVVEYDIEKQFTAARDTVNRLRGADDDRSSASNAPLADWLRRQAWGFFRNFRALSLFLLAALASGFLFRRRAVHRLPWAGADWAIGASWLSVGLGGAAALWYNGPSPAAWALAAGPPVLGTLLAWLYRRSLFDDPDARSRSRGTAGVSRMHARLIRDLERAGVDVPLSATADDIAQAAAPLDTDAAQTLRQWAALYQAARFGASEPSPETLSVWQKRLKGATKALRRAVREAERASDG